MKKILKLKYNCQVKNGRITGIKNDLENDLRNIEFADIVLIIEEIGDRKTLSQLKAFHGPVLDQVQRCHLENEGEYRSTDKIKEQLKDQFLEKKPIYWSDKTPVMAKVEHPEKDGVFFQYHVKATPSLSELSIAEMNNFITDIIDYYWQNYNWSIVIDESKKQGK